MINCIVSTFDITFYEVVWSFEVSFDVFYGVMAWLVFSKTIIPIGFFKDWFINDFKNFSDGFLYDFV